MFHDMKFVVVASLEGKSVKQLVKTDVDANSVRRLAISLEPEIVMSWFAKEFKLGTTDKGKIEAELTKEQVEYSKVSIRRKKTVVAKVLSPVYEEAKLVQLGWHLVE
jgi:hypothetical protein